MVSLRLKKEFNAKSRRRKEEFSLEKCYSINRCKSLDIKAEDRPRRTWKNVLTAKRGRFLGVLAAKQAFLAIKITLYFAFLLFFQDSLCCKPLMVINMQLSEGSKKNRA
jgi:hypothetical protein